MRTRRTSFPVQLLLAGFGVAVAAPLIVLLAILLLRAAATERTQLEQRLERAAEIAADSIDRDTDRRIALLQTLASSPLVTAEDWPRFYEQATAALADRAYIVFINSSGRQIVNTYVQFGQEPPFTGDPETLRRMLSSRQPIVSDLFVSLVVKKPVYNISIPVIREGQVRYIMSLGLLPADLFSILQSQTLDPNWIIAIWDRNDAILARTRDHDASVGKKMPDHLRVKQVANSVGHSISLEGDQVLQAVVPSRLSGWRITVSVPLEAAEAPLRSSMWLWSGLAALSLALATLFGILAGRFLSKPLIQAAAAARAFGDGKDIEVEPSHVHEVNDLIIALEEAGQRQRMLSGELAHRVKNILAVVQAVVSQSIGRAASVGEARDDVTSRVQSLARGHDLLVKSDWRGAPLHDIVNSELSAFRVRVCIKGDVVELPPQVVLPFALVLHELTTNAAKYGALSKPEGMVEIGWSRTADDCVQFDWRERGGPAVVPPAQAGFGTRVLKQAVRGGKATTEYCVDGLSYRLSIPLTPVEPTSEH